MPPAAEQSSAEHLWNKRLNPHSKSEVVILGGSTFPELAVRSAQIIDAPVCDVILSEFPDSETYARIGKTVRGKHVFVIQTDFKLPGRTILNGSPDEPWTINDSVFQSAQIVDAAKRSSASSITVIKPFFGYGRQDRTSNSRECVSANLHLDILAVAGMNHFVTFDLHAPQTASHFPSSDNMSATGLIADEIQKFIDSNQLDPNDVIFVAPDEGSLGLPKYYADEIGGSVSFIPKIRKSSGVERPVKKIKDVKDKTCILVDDMIATGGTIRTAVDVLDRSNAGNILVAATHGLFTGPALEKLEEASIDKLITTNTVPQTAPQELFADRHTVINVSPLIGAAVRIIATGGSMEEVYRVRRYRR